VPPIVASQRTSSRRARRPDHRQACANSTGQSLGTTKPKVSTQRRHVGRPRKRARSMGRRPPNCVRSSPISTHSGAGRRLLIRSCRGVALASSADGRRAWSEAGSVDRQKLAAGRAACVLGTCNGPAGRGDYIPAALTSRCRTSALAFPRSCERLHRGRIAGLYGRRDPATTSMTFRSSQH